MGQAQLETGHLSARLSANWWPPSQCSLRSDISTMQKAYDAAFKAVLGLTEKDVVPDVVLRAGIRYLLSQRAKEVCMGRSHRWRSPVCSRLSSSSSSSRRHRPAASGLARCLLLPEAALPLLQTSSCSGEEFYRRLQAFRDELASMPVAVQTAAANEQHYELPTEYFLQALGPHRKCVARLASPFQLPSCAQPRSTAGSLQQRACRTVLQRPHPDCRLLTSGCCNVLY